jgi:hypothetical protein
MDISKIKPYPNNAKKHDKKQIEQVAASIKEFGFNQPIVVDKEGVIIVGHGRYEAAKFLGMKEVPVLQVELSEEKAKAYRLADNKLNESGFDMDLVVAELKLLPESMIDLTGFDKTLILSEDDFGTSFVLPSGEKTPLQQMTFTLSNEQAEEIKQAISEIKETAEYKNCETFGNLNSNGNALYTIFQQWQQQKTSSSE